MIKRFCQEQGIMCELATEFGYCKITGCAHRTIQLMALYTASIERFADEIEREMIKGERK